MALLKATAAGLALHWASGRAQRALLFSRLPGGPGLLEATGPQGFAALCGCFGLCLVSVCVGCGTVTGRGAAAAAALRGVRPVWVSSCSGMGVFLGCGLAGALLGRALGALMVLGDRGLCLLALLLCLCLGLHLLPQEVEGVEALDPAGLLCLSATTFLVLYLGVCSGLAIDVSEPKVNVVHVVLLLISILMVFQAGQLVLQGHLSPKVLLLVPLAGILLGLDVQLCHQDPRWFHTGSLAQPLCSRLVGLSGGAGFLLGGLYLGACEAERDGSVSLWISGPTATLLHLLDPQLRLEAPVDFGLWLGLTAASGVSLGLAAVSLLKRCFQCVALAAGTPLDVGGADAAAEHKLLVLTEVAAKLAVLGAVLLGASLLGAAALLTASLGSAGRLGVWGASLLTLVEGICRVRVGGVF